VSPPTGATLVAAVIGDPVAHSRSPAIHNAAFAELGLDWVFVALPVPPGRGAAAVRAIEVMGLGGMSVTMPHKADAAYACDELTADARALGAVNAISRRPGGGVIGDSTDGLGFIRSLADEGVDPAGARVMVLGAGGAARAIVLALGRAGASITVAARRLGPAEDATVLAPDARAIELEAAADALAATDILVNATPLGMSGTEGDGLPFPAAALHPGLFVADSVYHPLDTPLLQAARAAGARSTNGLGMLVHQAAIAFTAWTGRSAPIDVMRRAAEAGSPG
jgi:shikimate dehydrogenase